jgi:hypothetical protein
VGTPVSSPAEALVSGKSLSSYRLLIAVAVMVYQAFLTVRTFAKLSSEEWGL